MYTGEKFPFAELTASDQLIMDEPIHDRQHMAWFLKVVAQPMFGPLPLVLTYKAGTQLASIFEDIPIKNGAKAAIKGAFLYAGVLRIASNFQNIPYSEEVGNRIRQEDAHRFSWKVYERLNEEAPTFCKIANDSSTTLEANTNSLQELVLMGAGLIHWVTVDSVSMDSSVARLEAEFGESLADMEATFYNIGNGE